MNKIPDKTIAYFFDRSEYDGNDINKFVGNLDIKRDWFTSHFYRCLPLSIANAYGFYVKSEFDFSAIWDGTQNRDSVTIKLLDSDKNLYPKVDSRFGSGIITLTYPFQLRTPPGVNLMTINPPNIVIENVTVMSGVIETDNLRWFFTFNLKLQKPNVETHFKKGDPLSGFIPIPRYYADGFNLKNFESIVSEDEYTEELQASMDFAYKRNEIEQYLPNRVGRDYYLGKDVYGNVFEDHQLPKRQKYDIIDEEKGGNGELD
jgi:hypothetical protein